MASIFPLTRPLGDGRLLRRGGALALVAALALITAPAIRAQSNDPVVARVDGKEIHESDLAVAEDDLASSLQQVPPAARRDYLITFFTDMTLVAKAAEAKKLGDTDDFKRRLAYARTKLLMEDFLQSEAKAAITDEAMHKVYDEAIAHAKREQEVRARHILVETEDEAKAVLAELKKGADFAELAKAKSKDPGSSDGGDLGYFTKEQMVPEFAEVAFKLDKGQISEPVKSQFGWHIIKVEDKREREPPPFEQVKDQIEQFLVRRAQTETITKLRAAAKIDRVEAPKVETPATPAPAAAPPAEQKK